MRNKIYRNDPCPCGSGKKYKHCCLNKSEHEKHFSAIYKASQNLKREAQEKCCLHPDKDHCSEKIIKTHAIQNNRILKKIAENGEVVTVDGQSNIIFQGTQTKGRKIATTFTGFCGHHDKTTFQDIEDREFEGSSKQLFLFAYRTLAWHFHKKREQAKANSIMRKRLSADGYIYPEDSLVGEMTKSLLLGIKDNQTELDDFNEALLKENYDILSSYIWTIPYEIEFAISMMHELEFDIEGNQINDLENLDKRPKKIYLNIFPGKGISYCIWSWLSIWDDYYKKFSIQFDRLSDEDKKNYFNNYLPRWSDAIIISPRLWKSWGSDIQESFITHANFAALYLQMEKETGEHKYEYMSTPWDLFSVIQQNN